MHKNSCESELGLFLHGGFASVLTLIVDGARVC